jgi:hypothetical protein
VNLILIRYSLFQIGLLEICTFSKGFEKNMPLPFRFKENEGVTNTLEWLTSGRSSKAKVRDPEPLSVLWLNTQPHE